MSAKEKRQLLTWVQEARAQGARQAPACNVVGISAKTFQRWKSAGSLVDRRQTVIKHPSNKLSEFEQNKVLSIVNSTEYANLPPSQIVPKLADKGQYIASESTMYRLLKADGQLAKRTSSRVYSHPKPQPFVATAPNQIYTWDITYLPSDIKGVFFYLYMVMDIFSRKIVGWQVHENETSARASDLMVDICLRENIQAEQVVLHSDNGSPMKGATMLATLQKLGIMPSFSRPSVSNDNPYSESLFRTFKYRPGYPDKRFTNLLNARSWVEGFVTWYNDEHCHSSIKFVTPTMRHQQTDDAILAKRQHVYEQAKAKHPNRWSGTTRNWTPVKEVSLNPAKENKVNANKAA